MIRPIQIRGFGTLEQRSYLLLSLAVGGLSADIPRQCRAIASWLRHIKIHPQFKSSLISDEGKVSGGFRDISLLDYSDRAAFQLRMTE